MNNLHPGDYWEKRFRDFNKPDFEEFCLGLYRFQFQQNAVYREYATRIGRSPERVRTWMDIPFLPISFFKSHRVVCGDFLPQQVFESSGTTGMKPSRHEVRHISLYEHSFRLAFEQFYGRPEEWTILGLLPSYLERGQSSLVYMVDALIRQSAHAGSGFYLYDVERLRDTLQELESRGQKTLLIGVTYALLDFAEKFPLELRHTVVMETGGMKGRKRELTREEVHEILKQRLGITEVHSEYGMTELLSQAYAQKGGRFECPPWMRVMLRDDEDPLQLLDANPVRTLSGAVNIIDLANIHSCAFIATEDMGRLHPDLSFDVLGRQDRADIRGCSLLAV